MVESPAKDDRVSIAESALNYKAIGRRDMGRPRMRWVSEHVCIT